MSVCWDSENIEKIKDESLPFIRLLFIDIYTYRWVKVYTVIFLIFHVPLWATQFYVFSKKFDVYLLAQYGPCSLMFIYIFSSMIISILLEKDVRGILDYLQIQVSWSIDTATREVKEDLRREANFAELIAKIHVLLGVITYISLLMRTTAEKEWELMYQVTFLKKYFPEYCNILIIIFLISLIYVIIPLLVPFYIVVYVTIYGCAQAKMLNDRIYKITENYSNSIYLTYDDDYQDQVYHRLRFCVKRFCDLKKFSENTKDIAPPFVVVFYILSILAITCYIGAWYMDPDIYYPLLFMFAVGSGYTLIVISEYGQLPEDMSMETYYAFSFLPWYTFRQRSQKMLLGVLVPSMSPIVLCRYESIPVNRRIILQIYKISSSVSALIVHSKRKIFN